VLINADLFTMSDPFLDLGCQQVALVEAVHQVHIHFLAAL